MGNSYISLLFAYVGGIGADQVASCSSPATN